MKKFIKRFLIVFGIIIGLLILFSAGFYFKMKSELKIMNPTQTGLLIENVFTIRDGHVNMYLVKTGEKFIVIDGCSHMDIVKKEIDKLKINCDSVTAVFLTHSDGDHVAAVPLFKNAKVYISRDEEQMINGKKHRFGWFNNNIHTDKYEMLDDGQIVNILNLKIQGIATPGHTPGSMSFFVSDRYLFTGDVLSLKDGKVGKFNKFFTMDGEKGIESIKKLSTLTQPEYIFTAHYGFTGDYKNAFNDLK